MTTTRLYHQDSYLKEFTALIVGRADNGLRIYLERTAFYPSSGGQPHDIGEIAGQPVVDVIDEDQHIAHIVEAPVVGQEVLCRIDWTRRFDHMQQHSGQHLLSAVLIEQYKAETVGFHMGGETSTIDLDIPALTPDQLAAAERRVNELVAQNLPVTVALEAAAEAKGLRRPSEREGILRIVSIEGLDRSPCGGTHVKATGEIGPVLLRKTERIRGTVRLEFLCGMRAVNRARNDFEALSRIARVFSCSPDEAPQLVTAQREAAEAAEKKQRKAAQELAGYRGRELYHSTAPGEDGIRRHVERRESGSLSEEVRALAQAFTAGSRAVFVVAIDDPPAVLLAASTDAGLHAGSKLKELLTAQGGRGGGSAAIAQGSLPSKIELSRLLGHL